jgi:hypothetical protein
MFQIKLLSPKSITPMILFLLPILPLLPENCSHLCTCSEVLMLPQRPPVTMGSKDIATIIFNVIILILGSFDEFSLPGGSVSQVMASDVVERVIGLVREQVERDVTPCLGPTSPGDPNFRSTPDGSSDGSPNGSPSTLTQSLDEEENEGAEEEVAFNSRHQEDEEENEGAEEEVEFNSRNQEDEEEDEGAEEEEESNSPASGESSDESNHDDHQPQGGAGDGAAGGRVEEAPPPPPHDAHGGGAPRSGLRSKTP